MTATDSATYLIKMCGYLCHLIHNKVKVIHVIKIAYYTNICDICCLRAIITRLR